MKIETENASTDFYAEDASALAWSIVGLAYNHRIIDRNPYTKLKVRSWSSTAFQDKETSISSVL